MNKGNVSGLRKFYENMYAEMRKGVVARYKYRHALYHGILVPKPCEVCGEKKAEGHHPDYDEPLEVSWLCERHHKMLHSVKFETPEASRRAYYATRCLPYKTKARHLPGWRKVREGNRKRKAIEARQRLARRVTRKAKA